MNLIFNRFPTYTETLTTKGATTRGWYQYWSGLFQGQPTGNVSVIKVGTSPYIYVSAVGGSLIVSGGTTTLLEYSRDDQNFYVLGVTSGMFPMSLGDNIRITYSGALPTVVFVPR
jgi:hypothetical protein